MGVCGGACVCVGVCVGVGVGVCWVCGCVCACVCCYRLMQFGLKQNVAKEIQNTVPLKTNLF